MECRQVLPLEAGHVDALKHLDCLMGAWISGCVRESALKADGSAEARFGLTDEHSAVYRALAAGPLNSDPDRPSHVDRARRTHGKYHLKLPTVLEDARHALVAGAIDDARTQVISAFGQLLVIECRRERLTTGVDAERTPHALSLAARLDLNCFETGRSVSRAQHHTSRVVRIEGHEGSDWLIRIEIETVHGRGSVQVVVAGGVAEGDPESPCTVSRNLEATDLRQGISAYLPVPAAGGVIRSVACRT
jgi:hypothetical protein